MSDPEIIEIPLFDIRLKPIGTVLRVEITNDPEPEPPLRYEYFKQDFNAP